MENVQTFGFLPPILSAVARLLAWLRVDHAACATDLAEHPAVEAAFGDRSNAYTIRGLERDDPDLCNSVRR